MLSRSLRDEEEEDNEEEEGIFILKESQLLPW